MHFLYEPLLLAGWIKKLFFFRNSIDCYALLGPVWLWYTYIGYGYGYQSDIPISYPVFGESVYGYQSDIPYTNFHPFHIPKKRGIWDLYKPICYYAAPPILLFNAHAFCSSSSSFHCSSQIIYLLYIYLSFSFFYPELGFLDWIFESGWVGLDFGSYYSIDYLFQLFLLNYRSRVCYYCSIFICWFSDTHILI